MGGQPETLCGRYVLCEKLRTWYEHVPHEETTRVQTRSPSMSMFFSTHMSSSSGSSSVMWTELCALCLCFLLDSRWDDLCFFFVLCSPSLSLLRLLFDDRPSPMVRGNVGFTQTGNLLTCTCSVGIVGAFHSHQRWSSLGSVPSLS